MKYILHEDLRARVVHGWNGVRELPGEICVRSSVRKEAEFELLQVLCGLHGYVTAFDLLTGSDPDTEKDADLTCILETLQGYLYPTMPLSHYLGSQKRMALFAPIVCTPPNALKEALVPKKLT